MTTPRLATVPASRAVNAAAIALATLNPGVDVVFDEAPNDVRTHRRISGRLAGLKRSQSGQGIQTWTRVDPDGFVRGYVRKPAEKPRFVFVEETAPIQPIVVRTTTENLDKVEQPKAKRKHQSWKDRPFQETMDPKRSRPDSNQRAYNKLINGDPHRPSKWTLVTIYPTTNVGPAYIEEAKRRLESRRSSFINYARRRGTEVTTRIVRAEKTIRLEAHVV